MCTKYKLEGAVHTLKSRKVPGLDGINLEIFKLGGVLLKLIFTLLNLY
jgi:hypothetical protein